MSASILVVEDEEPIQILLSYNLEAEGYRVASHGRGRGRAAADRARNGPT